jgi:hypothetical protein
LTLSDSLTVTTAAGTGVALTGVLTAGGNSITKAGAGSVQFEHVRAASLAVSFGLAKLSAKTTPNSPSGTSVVSSWTIASGATLDITNNSLIVDHTAETALEDETRLHLLNDRLISSSADQARGIGYGENAVLNLTSFAGQSVDSTSMLVKFTFFGDSDLDGDVDVADLGNLASNWQSTAPWTRGDFDYTGFVDVNDLGLLASNWQAGVGSPLGPSLGEALASVGLGAAAVPEPANLGLVPLLGLLARRRRV